MPLPLPNTPWPPKPSIQVADHYDMWAAWYSGNPDDLTRVYGADGTAAGATWGANRVARTFFTQDRPGLRNFIARWFWGTATSIGEQRTKLHLPIGGDLAAISADLLFAEPPTITAPGTQAAQDRLEDYVEDGLFTALREAAEVGAAYGGVYLRVVWDDQIRERPWLAASAPDTVIPEWRWDQLSAATFWRVLDNGSSPSAGPNGDTQVGTKQVVRHLERHESGAILHAVYEGTKDSLGTRVPLTEYPETADLAAYLDDGDTIETGTKKLTAGYIPNMRPNRVWRNTPEATNLGRSDFSGIEGLMDALDETYSSWMRDLRLGKSRIIVDRRAVESLGKGKGATFDTDRELLAGLDLGPQPDHPITQVQFAIRTQEHQQTATELLNNIIQSAGYSVQTLTGSGSGRAMTATEVASRERRSLLTRGRKVNYWGPVIRDLLQAMLDIDANRFRPAGLTDGITPRLDWPKMVFVDPIDTATVVQMLRDAQVVSQETGIRMLHPDWTDEQVQMERARIAIDAGTPYGQYPVDADSATEGTETVEDPTGDWFTSGAEGVE